METIQYYLSIACKDRWYFIAEVIKCGDNIKIICIKNTSEEDIYPYAIIGTLFSGVLNKNAFILAILDIVWKSGHTVYCVQKVQHVWYNSRTGHSLI